MTLIRIPLGPGSDPGRSKPAGAATLTNCFAEVSTEGKAPFSIFTDPGLVDYAEFADQGGTRGLFVLGSKRYAIADETLFSVAASGEQAEIGTVLGTKGVITAANKKAGGAQVAIVADSAVYVLENDALAAFSDPDLPSGIHSVDWMDGYGIFGVDDGTFGITAINEFDDIDALDFSEAEGDPDGGVRVLVVGRELWYFGERSIEVFTNTGNVEFPFERLGGGFIPLGCKGKHTPRAFDNSVAWVDHVGRVMRAEGYVGRRISNHGVEADVQRTIDAQRVDEMEAFTFADGGHEFYQLSGPDWTWRYDAATKLWARKRSHGMSRSKIRHYVRASDQHIVGDLTAGKLYQMTFDAADEAGDYLVTSIVSPVIDEPGQGIVWDAVRLDVTLGVGVRNGGAHDEAPALRLRWSDDGNRTWSAWRSQSLGEIGKYRGRMQFNDLGASGAQGRAFEVAISAPVERCVIQGFADVRYCGI